MFELFKKSRTLLGMNARNLQYVRPHNRRRAKRLADQKILCKRVLTKNNLPVPRLIAKIANTSDLEEFDWNSLPASFALKPNRGFGGEGILVVYGKKKNGENVWIKADGSKIKLEDIKTHVRNILDGSFSLSNTPDVAFFEERLTLLKLFKPYAFKGIPDIRVIVFNNVPVMAMLRLPTKESGGKANLQQGAIGLGIDLASGTTTTAVLGKGKIIDYVPGTRLALSGIKIPYWKDILTMAVKAQQISGLGFLGADIAIDRERGPVFLELNARPGLSIQIANLDGLKGRLDRVVGLKVKSVTRGVRVGMDLFGGEIEEELEEISGKKIIGSIEKVKLASKDGGVIEVEAKIDTGADSTSIDTELAKKLGFEDLIKYFDTLSFPEIKTREEGHRLHDEILDQYTKTHPNLADISIVYASNGISVRPKVQIPIEIGGVEILAKATITNRSHLVYPVIIGRKSLKKFLIDINK